LFVPENGHGRSVVSVSINKPHAIERYFYLFANNVIADLNDELTQQIEKPVQAFDPLGIVRMFYCGE
jgi:hypothetical protein